MLRKILIAGLCIFFLACKSKKTAPKSNTPPPPVSVDVVIATPQSLSNTVEANGSVVANETLQIHPEVSGRLTYLNVPDGARISAGTILARINDADLQAQLNKSKVQLSLAVTTEQRLKKLLQINGINQADYDIALNAVNNIKADIDILKAQIDKTVVKAPFSGVLGLRMTSPGAYITPQTTLATLQQTDHVKIDFAVPELYAGIIRKGAIVTVLTNDNNAKRTASIIAAEPDINTSTRNLKVRAILNGAPVNPGTFVKVLIDAGGNSSSIIVPANAIIPDATSKKLIVIKAGKGTFVNVETGQRTATGVEIVSGISAGDTVVVTGVLFVKPNAVVKIKSVK